MSKASLVSQAYERISTDIRSGYLKPNEQGRLPSQEELAGLYGVGLTTIKRVVTRLESDGLVQSYRGRGLVLNEEPSTEESARMLHFAVPYFNVREHAAGSPSADLLLGIQDFAKEYNIAILTISFPDPQIDLQQAMISNPLMFQGLDGMILTVEVSSASIAHLMKTNMPFVTHHLVADEAVVCHIGDHVHACLSIADAVLRRGCKHVAFFASSPNRLSGLTIRSCWEQACARYGLTPESSYICDNDYDLSAAQEFIRDILDNGRPLDGIIAFDDVMAAHLQEYLESRGRTDVLMAGGGNMHGYEDKVRITYDTNSRLIGYNLAQSLFEIVNGNRPKITKRSYSGRLIERDI